MSIFTCLAINAYGSAVDLALRVRLKKEGMDPRKDVNIIEIGFANIGAAIREKRADCGVLILPFMNTELQKGGLRPIFTGGDAFGPYAVIFHVVTNNFLKANRAAVTKPLRKVSSRVVGSARGASSLTRSARYVKPIAPTSKMSKAAPAKVL